MNKSISDFVFVIITLSIIIIIIVIITAVIVIGAIEVDVDAICDKDGDVVICGIMEHIEEAGVHSGDSACALPPQTLTEEDLGTIREWSIRIAK